MKKSIFLSYLRIGTGKDEYAMAEGQHTDKQNKEIAIDLRVLEADKYICRGNCN